MDGSVYRGNRAVTVQTSHEKMARVFTQAIFIGSYALTHELEALFGQFGTDLFDLDRVAGSPAST